jgi:hypothetical protein
MRWELSLGASFSDAGHDHETAVAAVVADAEVVGDGASG